MSACNMYYPLSVYSSKFQYTYLNLSNKELRQFKINLKDRPQELKNNLHRILAHIYYELEQIVVSRNSKHCVNIESLVKKVIPIEYFGSLLNRRRFLFIVKRIMTHTDGECIHTSFLYENYDYEAIPWLRQKHIRGKHELEFFNVLLLESVVKALIKHFYVFMKDYKGRKIIQIPRDKYYMFNDKIFSKQIQSGFITHNHENLDKATLRGTLKWVPKRNMEQLCYRPIIITFNKDKQLQRELKRKVTLAANNFKVTCKEKMFDGWLSYLQQTEGKRLFAIKLDMADAFGNVDINVLCTILEKCSILTKQEINYLCKHIKQQFVYRPGKNICQWHHGLMQGDCLSSSLCDLYLSYLEHENMIKFALPRCFMHRTVDDMLYISTHQRDILDFELHACNVFRLNERKTLKYLGTKDCNPCIPYYGKVFNFNTKEFSNYYEFEKGTQLRTKFKFWNPKYPYSADNVFQFITSSMKFQYLNFCFTKFELNSQTNSVETILKNFYLGMCYVAFKMDCAIQAIKYAFLTPEKFNLIVLNVIEFILETYCKKVLSFIGRYKGDVFRDVFSFKLLNTISLRAFVVVLRKRYLTYKEIIKVIKDRLTKSKMPFKQKKINLDVKYFFKLPNVFENIRMKRTFQK
ncbi:uncharacterized protein LOC132705925 [Cylas formicarius]|uniref:uncharacterized protein LOC132705925 n=1 Tax=Cylas formicarius TaxID=197179 RepID=UPI002958B823|nr:uncharacterized protein LOC132705925 [Cylas formicarius]